MSCGPDLGKFWFIWFKPTASAPSFHVICGPNERIRCWPDLGATVLLSVCGLIEPKCWFNLVPHFQLNWSNYAWRHNGFSVIICMLYSCRLFVFLYSKIFSWSVSNTFQIQRPQTTGWQTVCHQNIRAKVRYMQFVTHCERFKRICVNPSVKFTYAVYPKSLLFEQVKQIDSLSGCSGW